MLDKTSTWKGPVKPNIWLIQPLQAEIFRISLTVTDTVKGSNYSACKILS